MNCRLVAQGLLLVFLSLSFENLEAKSCGSRLQSLASGVKSFFIPSNRIDDTKVIRSPFVEPGLYRVSKENTSSGERVADLDEASIDAYLAEHLNHLGDDVLFLVGTPFYGTDSKALKNYLQDQLSERQRDNRVRQIHHPKNAVESIRAFFPAAQDLQRITMGEIKKGLWKLSISGTTPIAVLYATQDAAIALETALIVGGMNLLQSAVMTFPRQSWGNWQTRSKTGFTRYLKQFMLSSVFTAGLFWAGAVATDVAQAAGKTWEGSESAVAFASIATLAGWSFLAQSKIGSAIFATLWRTPVHQGVYEWVNQKTKAAPGDRSVNEWARDQAARIEMWASLITTQFFIYSSIMGKEATLFRLAFDWNAGHIGMAVMGVLGAIAWAQPKIYDGVVPILDKIHAGVKHTVKSPLYLYKVLFNIKTKRQEDAVDHAIDALDEETRRFHRDHGLQPDAMGEASSR